MDGRLQEIAKKLFSKVSLKNEFYNLYTHTDVDGVLSNYLLTKILDHHSIRYKINYLHNLTEEQFLSLKEPYIITDLGANFSNAIPENSLCFDHHVFEIGSDNYISPFNVGIDGSNDLCTTSLIYFFGLWMVGHSFKEFGKEALIGIHADVQTDNLLSGGSINSLLMLDLIAEKALLVRNTLDVFGSDRYPLKFFLTLNFQAEVVDSLLSLLGIPVKLANSLRVSSLLPEHLEELSDYTNFKIVSKPYFKVDQFEENAGIYATLFNSSCRLDKFKDILNFLSSRKKEQKYKILQANKDIFNKKVDSYFKLRKNIEAIQNDFFDCYLYADKLDYRYCGYLANKLGNGKPTFVFSKYTEIESKFSMRGRSNLDVHYGEFLSKIDLESLQTGGHKNAAGGIIRTDKVPELIEILLTRFKELVCVV